MSVGADFLSFPFLGPAIIEKRGQICFQSAD